MHHIPQTTQLCLDVQLGGVKLGNDLNVKITETSLNIYLNRLRLQLDFYFKSQICWIIVEFLHEDDVQPLFL